MKNKIIAFITAIPFIFSVNLSDIHADELKYTYTIIRNEAVITGYRGSPEKIKLPEKIDGCPVTEIRDNAFFDCKSLKKIEFPNTLERIGHHSFYACISLESVDIPKTVRAIGTGAFCGCTSLSDAEIDADTEYLPESCFRACTSLTEITIPESVDYIGNYCFSGCTALSCVSLGENTEKIGKRAFYMCNSLGGIYIPPCVNTIGERALGYIPENNEPAPKQDFCIMGSKKSKAEEYADENNISFRIAEEAIQTAAINTPKSKMPVKSMLLFFLGTAVFSLLLFLSIRYFFGKKRV
ncbi:MAG: leucine-rich repeat domain-containing protein [Ruminococcus sp.]|nr:leucine-rich repeat domain-containing protein [Ruminococcus sp.]